MENCQYTCVFAGEAGYGVMSAGAFLAKGASRNGLWGIVVNEYPSLIKGGLNSCLVRIAETKVDAYDEQVDFLGVLSQPGYDLHIAKVRPGGIVLYDSKAVTPNSDLAAPGVIFAPVGLLNLAPGDAGKIMANSALLGAFCALTGFNKDIIQSILHSEISKEELKQKNLAIFDNAYQAAAAITSGSKSFPLSLSADKTSKMLINGNDAIALGALYAGCKFAAGYPMTPGSSILMYLAEHGPQFGLVFKQAEDEVAAINMLIGASFAGVRGLVSTSGGGFSLMVEALGFAAQAEIPIVIVNAQRGGPSTGLPTRTAQADLSFAAHASQGEFPRFLLAPGDVEECFLETFRLFNVTEEFQVPGILLTDKYLADTSFIHEYFTTDSLSIDRGKLVTEHSLAESQPYLRYKLTDDGISPRALPGMKGGCHIATSYTHGEDGFYSSGNKEFAGSEAEITAAGLDKWFRKVPLMEQSVPGIKFYGDTEADLTIIAWGSTKGAILAAMEEASRQGLKVNFVQILYILPFPVTKMTELQQTIKLSLLIEGNKTAQLGALIRSYTGYKPDHVYLKYDSRPFTTQEILLKIREVL